MRGTILRLVAADGVPILEPLPADPKPELADDPTLQQILKSRTFEKTPTLRSLLTYLWEHRFEDVSEYAIATEALKRKPDFETRSDATVRVLVSRLRQRLKQFYEEDGTSHTARLVIPVGTHQIQLVHIEPQTETSLVKLPLDNERPVTIRKRTFSRLILLAQFVVIILLALSTGWLLLQLHYQRSQRAQTNAGSVPVFWKQFFGNAKNTTIIVPTPTFFTWNRGLVARDVQVNDYAVFKNSAYLDYLGKHFGKPALAEQYVASYDALGAFDLSRYLDSEGHHVDVSTAAQTSLDDLDRDNVILMGNVHTLSPFSYILDQIGFRLDQDTGRVVDLRAGPGQASYYDRVVESRSRIITPCIIAFIPGRTAGSHVLALISGSFTAALVAYLISDAGMQELEHAQAAHRNCPYFEALVLMEVDGTKGMKGKLTLFRSFNPNS